MIHDHVRCEWVNVSSDTGSPGLSQRAINWLCVCVLHVLDLPLRRREKIS